MKKIIFAVFTTLFILFFVSCNSDSVSEIDKTVKSIQLSRTVDKEVFYLNDINGTQTLNVKFFNKDGKEIPGSVVWRTDFEEKEVYPITSSSPNSMTFDVNSVNKLDDFTITAQLADHPEINAKYNFSLFSKDELKNSLSYSYVNAGSVEIERTDKFFSIKTIKEYDATEKRIRSNGDRMILGSSISFFPNGQNLIFINQKEGSAFGNLQARVLQGEDVILLQSDEDSLLVSAPAREQEILLSISAGTKDEKQLKINALRNTSKLAETTYTEFVNAAEHDGKLLTIMGDNITNKFEPIENGYELEIEIERKPLGTDDESYESYSDWKNTYNDPTKNETRDISQGKIVHLEHAGHYKITSYITSATLSSDPVVKEVDIFPYPTEESCLSLSAIGTSPIINASNWNSYNEGESPRVEKFSLSVSNTLPQGNRYVRYYYTADPTEISSPFACPLVPQKIEPGQSINTKFKSGGTYKVVVWTNDVHNGYGKLYEDEIVTVNNYASSQSLAPYGYIKDFEIKGKLYSQQHLSVSGTTSYNVKNILSSMGSNDKMYVALFKDGSFSEMFNLAAGETRNIPNNDWRAYSLRSYVFSSDNRMSSDIQNLNCPPQALRVSGNISPSQGVRCINITISNSRNSFGQNRILWYQWTSAETQPSYNASVANQSSYGWVQLGQNNSYSLTKTSEGRQYLWVLTMPYNETATPVVNHASITLTIPTLTATASSYSGDDIQDARNQRKVRIYNPTYTGLNGGTYRRNMYIQKNWGGYVNYGAAEYVDLSHNWEGNCTYHVKLVAGDYENAKGETITTINVNLVKLPIVTVGHEWFGVFSWDHSVWIGDVYPGATVQCSGFDGNKTLHSTGEHYYEAWPGDYGNVTTMQWKIGYMDSDSYTFYAGQ